MLKKIDVSLLRRGDILRFRDDEQAATWFVKSVENDKIILELNTFFYLEAIVVKKTPRRKKYVFVEVE